MECHKTNSSLDTVLILDCEEDFKSAHSSIDTDILNYDEEKPRKHHRHYKSKSEHRRRNNQRKKYSDNRAFKAQEINADRQEFRCIINLNATVCDHENSHHRCCDRKSMKDPKYKYKRTVPLCLRQSCHQSKHRQTMFRHSKEHSTTGTHYRARHTNECKTESKRGNHRRSHPHHKKKQSKQKQILKQNEQQTISPPKKQIESDYEDISTISLDSYLDIPTSYKHVVNKDREYQESKLDTLIKRSKERERRLVEQSRKIPWYTSTPAYSDVNSEECPISCSEIDVSLHSRSTLILEPRDHGHSPSIEGLCPTIDKYWQYSPSSQTEENIKFSDKRDLELEIKREPLMNIAAYSPTQSSDFPELKEQWIKKEVKIEPTVGKHDA